MSNEPVLTHALRGKRSQLAFLAGAEMLAMGLWFSASAVVPQLTEIWALDAGLQSWLTMSVQIGFVIGALLSALLNLPDRISSRKLFAYCALAGASFNLAIPLLGLGVGGALILRFLTGISLAGVYPPGMKLVATWCREDRGFGIGLLVGALTFGSGVPHLLNAGSLGGEIGMPSWRIVLIVTSILAVVAAVIAFLFVKEGPFLTKPAPFDWRFAGRLMSERSVRLANLGYLGHMWELYAMWAWAPFFMLASYDSAGLGSRNGRLAGFAVVAAGAVGCVVAGILADRVGRTAIAIASLVVSGSCAAIAGFFFSSPVTLTVICLVWGFAVVADSAQFSAAVSELTDARYVGTALTLQTSLGFLLTLLTIRMVPPIAERFGWQRAFLFLAIGPIVGVWAMATLRLLPEATRMASGRR